MSKFKEMDKTKQLLKEPKFLLMRQTLDREKEAINELNCQYKQLLNGIAMLKMQLKTNYFKTKKDRKKKKRLLKKMIKSAYKDLDFFFLRQDYEINSLSDFNN